MNWFCFLVLLLQLQGVQCTVTTEKSQTRFAGQSITVPCNYSSEYTSNVKYWCKGSTMVFCHSLARTDQSDADPNGIITIRDDPTQQVFTVTMHDLKETDSNYYWCVVEIGGIWSGDHATWMYINVVQGVSVETNKVSAEEGGSVILKFHYSEKHRKNEKKWCRSGDSLFCKTTNNGVFSSESLIISDDRKDTITVTMRQLQMRDAGWYYCGSGEHRVPVQVLVTLKPTTTASEVKTQSHLCDDSDGLNIWQSLLIACGVMVFMLSVVLVTWFWIRKKCQKIPNHSPLDDSESQLKICPRKSGGWNRSIILLNSLAQVATEKGF